jgi:hypothetical protein
MKKVLVILVVFLISSHADAKGRGGRGGYSRGHGGHASYGSGRYGNAYSYRYGHYAGIPYGGYGHGVSVAPDPPPPIKWNEKSFEEIEVPEGMKKELKPDGTFYFGDRQ